MTVTLTVQLYVTLNVHYSNHGTTLSPHSRLW